MYGAITKNRLNIKKYNSLLYDLDSSSGDITIHYLSGEMNQHPVMRWIPWFADINRRIMALCFDPSGSWLLVAGELKVMLFFHL